MLVRVETMKSLFSSTYQDVSKDYKDVLLKWGLENINNVAHIILNSLDDLLLLCEDIKSTKNSPSGLNINNDKEGLIVTIDDYYND